MEDGDIANIELFFNVILKGSLMHIVNGEFEITEEKQEKSGMFCGKSLRLNLSEL